MFMFMFITDIMSLGLQKFPDRTGAVRHVFCPNSSDVVVTFEDHLPTSDGHKIHRISSSMPPDCPAQLSWNKTGYDYHAFLPKNRTFEGHLLTPLNHHRPISVQRDGRWYIDDNTIQLWQSLDINFSRSIRVIGSRLLVELDHYEPIPAISYGFTRGHKSQQTLEVALRASRHAFIHRLAYLTYLIACRYKWDTPDLRDQPWWSEFVAAFVGYNWVDSVWDTVCKQWAARDFIGVAVCPSEASVKWLRAALHFGVPIWVSMPKPGCYDKQDGGSVIASHWMTSTAEVGEARAAQKAKLAALQAESTVLDPSNSSLPTPLNHSQSPSPPTVLPPGARWYESWQAFFDKRDEARRVRREGASSKDKQSWESRAAVAAKFHPPGKNGPKVFTWDSCDSGGFFRTQLTRSEAADGWDTFYKKGLVFCPEDNVWDYCPFRWAPAVESGAPDDTGSDDEEFVGEQWYARPDLPATPPLPNDNPSSLEFLYRRYGFLSVQPTTPAQVMLPLDTSTANRTVGLVTREDGGVFDHLNSFISSIIQGQLPAGHCDLSLHSPPREMFPPATRTSLNNTLFYFNFPELSEDMVFVLVGTSIVLQAIVIHDSLSALQLFRAGTVHCAVEFLVNNGCRFTVLHSYTLPPSISPPHFMTSAIRDQDWKATKEDYAAYMSRLKTFFLERPHMVAAAFSRGGIAWRIAREVLGVEGVSSTILETRPEQASLVDTSRGTYWYHAPYEGEWFYLVGGYELLTGLLTFSVFDFMLTLSRKRRTEAGPFMVAKGQHLGW